MTRRKLEREPKSGVPEPEEEKELVVEKATSLSELYEAIEEFGPMETILRYTPAELKNRIEEYYKICKTAYLNPATMPALVKKIEQIYLETIPETGGLKEKVRELVGKEIEKERAEK